VPYSNIVFVKLFLSLFEEDDRFLYQLNESQQLLYIKLLYLAASSGNQIPKNHRFICHKVNYHHEEECLKSDIKRISEVFKRFKETDKFYHFEKFEELHNYIPRKSDGNPKDVQRIVPEEEEDKNKKKNKTIPPTLEDVSKYCLDRKNGVDPKKWFDHYEAKGWLIGKNKMVNWQAAIRTWEKGETKEPFRKKL
jgi:hypothetical protein